MRPPAAKTAIETLFTVQLRDPAIASWVLSVTAFTTNCRIRRGNASTSTADPRCANPPLNQYVRALALTTEANPPAAPAAVAANGDRPPPARAPAAPAAMAADVTHVFHQVHVGDRDVDSGG